MAKINSNRKLTCFLCRYEISKHNELAKQQKFNGKLRPICRYCTKNKHKPLDVKYNEKDIQCKICNKPTMYKKCIACSICDHFYHGKCLQLNKQDIETIEKTCDFFISTKCNHDIFPNTIDICDKAQKCTTKQKSKNCLTCNETVPKFNYANKYLLYNEKKQCLCKNCSKLGLDIPVRDKSLIEFQDCAICRKQVKFESIYCNLCQHLVHPYCNGIDKKELSNLSKSTDNWYCYDCNLKIYPHHLLKSTLNTKKQNSTKKILRIYDL